MILRRTLSSIVLLGIMAMPLIAYAGTNTFIMPNVQLQQNQASGTFGVALTNQDTPSALSLTFTYNPTIGFDITGAALSTRTQSLFDAPAFNKTVIDATTTQIQVLVYKMSGTPPQLPAGAGDILQFTYTTTASGSGTTPLTISEALVSDGSGSPLGKVATQNGSVIFQAMQYPLTVTKTGSGTVTSSPTGIACGADCAETYEAGTAVTLTATADSGSVFIGWSGACTNSTGTCSVTMSAAKSVTATFTPQYTLTVTKTGNGTGTVTSSPAGISCGADCTEAYLTDTSVTLTAAAAAGSTFTGWTGGGCTGTNACVVSMNANMTVTANFNTITPQYALTVTKTGTGAGTVTSAPAGISCGADCSKPYNAGTVVTLSAAPSTGSKFIGWSGACTGTGSCMVTMNAAKTVTATFALLPTQYTLTVNKAGTGGGTVTSAPTGISCGADCAEIYNAGMVVTLTATPATGSAFSGWSGNCFGTGACTVTLTAAKTVTAMFTLRPTTYYPLTVTKAGTGAGTITSLPAGISCGADCAETYATGAAVTLTATPAAGSTFAGWFGGCAGTGSCAVTMNAAKTVTALFTTLTACAVKSVCNGDFEQGLARWGSLNNAELTTGRTGVGMLVRSDNANSDVSQFMKPDSTLSNNVFAAGQWYQVTAWCKAAIGTKCGLYLGDANTWYNPPAYQRETRRFFAGTGGWQNISAELFLDKPEILSVYLYAPTAGSAVAYDDVAIQPLAACPERAICNGDFEQAYAFWGGTENANLTTGRAGMGLKISYDTSNADSFYRLSGVFPGGATYRVRAWCLADAGEECRLFFGDANTLYGPPYEHVGAQILPGNGQWQQVTATVTLVHDEALGINLYSKTPNSAVIYDDVTLETLQPHLVWNKGTAGQAQFWNINPTTGQMLETQSINVGANWQAAHAQWYEDGTTTLLWRNAKNGRGMAQRRAADGALLSQYIYGPLSGWKAASYQRQGDGTATLLWMNGTGRAKLWYLNAAGVKISEKILGALSGWVAVNHQRQADGAMALLWRNTTNGRARVWMLNAQGQKLNEVTYSRPAAGWIPVNYARYADGTATLLWRNATNGRGRVWRLNAGGEKVSEQTYIPATGWKAAAYLQSPQRYQANMITIWKTGTGSGAVTIGNSVCSSSCGIMQIPVTSGVTQTVTATPTTGSAFAGWRNAKGQTLTGLEYLRAGDEVFAVFNKQ